MSYLQALGLKHGTDKSYWHFYCDFYNEKLFNKRLEIKNVLELGIFNGSSLRMWKEYFPIAHIDSIDIKEEYIFQEDRISTYLCGQTDFSKMNEIFGTKTFDLIIDDAGHNPEFQVESFRFLFQKYLNPGGIYIIEDLHTSIPGMWLDCKKETEEGYSTFSAVSYLNLDVFYEPFIGQIESIVTKHSKSQGGDISTTSIIQKH